MGNRSQKTYVVYDQFHWGDINHLEYLFKGFRYALENYRFLKEAHPDKTLGMLEIEKYKLLKISLNKK